MRICFALGFHHRNKTGQYTTTHMAFCQLMAVMRVQRINRHSVRQCCTGSTHPAPVLPQRCSVASKLAGRMIVDDVRNLGL